MAGEDERDAGAAAATVGPASARNPAGKSAGRVPRLATIDGIRAYAILSVVLLHLLFVSGALAGSAGTPFGIVTWGLLGNILDVFFIASGFVLFLPFVVAGARIDSVRDYAIGRAIRLLPAYWFSIAIVLVLLALFPFDGRSEPLPGTVPVGFPSSESILVHLLALQMPVRMIHEGFLVGFGVNGPLWMISVIVGFYVLLPLVARGYCRHPIIGLLAALAVTVAWKEAVSHFGGALSTLMGGQAPFFAQLVAVDQLPGWVFSFGLGMTGAWAYHRYRQHPPTRDSRRIAIAATIVAVVVFVPCAYLYGVRASELNVPFSGSAARLDTWLGVAYTASRAVLIAAVALGPLWLQRPFTIRPVAKLAPLSYGLYLIHFPVAVFVCSLLLELPSGGTAADVVVWSGVVIPVSLAYAYLSARFVEQPARSWWKRQVAGRRAARLASAGLPTSAVEARLDATDRLG